ncbi:MAG: ABC transporter permease subunit [Chloroflexi bacterium]|nr:ABC transporter permease subunit [Chloroflexota bacterium]
MSSAATTMTRIAFRNHRTSMITLAAIGAVFALANAGAFPQIAGDTVAERTAFGRSMEILGRQFTYLLPMPERIDTLGGFVHWRAYGLFSLMFGIWGVMAGTGSTRGQEDHGNWEQWLAAGIPRTRLIVLSTVGFLAAAAIPVLLILVATMLGSAAGGIPEIPDDSLRVSAVSAEVLSLFALTWACFGVGMLSGQIMSNSRGATGLGVSVVLSLFFLNSMSRTLSGLDGLTWLSPFSWFDKTNPMVPGGAADITGIVVLFATAIALSAITVKMFLHRDLGSALIRRTLLRPADYTPSTNLLLRIPVVADIYEQRLSLASWTIGTVVMAAFIGSFAKSALDFMVDSPSLAPYLEILLQGNDNVYEAMLGYSGFNLMQLILAAFVITVVSRWASDDTDGRLEIILSTPISRWRVLVERVLMLAIASLTLILTSSTVMVGTLAAQGIDVSPGRVISASLLMLPFALGFAAGGTALATWRPRIAVGVMSVIAVTSFLLVQIGPLLSWPDWVLNMSVFSQVGNPVTQGIYWTGLWLMMAMILVGFTVSWRNFLVRDVGR